MNERINKCSRRKWFSVCLYALKYTVQVAVPKAVNFFERVVTWGGVGVVWNFLMPHVHTTIYSF